MVRTLPLLLVACAPRPVPIEVGVAPDAASRVAIVGRVDDRAVVHEILAEALADEVHAVVLLGDPVRRGTRREWGAALDRWSEVAAVVPVIPTVGGAVAAGDPGLARLGEAFPGLAPYGTLAVGGLRLVRLDTSDVAARHAEESYWLPRAMGEEGPKVVLAPDGPHADALVRAALDYATAAEPPFAVFTPGATSGCDFPGGTFGEARVVVGPAAEGWWTVEGRTTGSMLSYRSRPGDHDAGSRAWSHDPLVGWRTIPTPSSHP